MGPRGYGAVLLAVVLALCAVVIPAPAAHAGGAEQEMDAYLRERMSDAKAPGMAYAIVDRREVEHIGTMGKDGDGDPVTARTPFLWGSVAKPVTATAVMKLVEDGKVDLDRPVRAYLPDFTLEDRAAAARITVRHLLQQTSGLPEVTDATDRFEHRRDPYRSAVAKLADVSPLAEPGAKHIYASANYLLLGAVVEAVTGRPFAAYLRTSVLDPLHMTGAITTRAQAARLPDGHGYVYGQPAAMSPRFDETGPSYGYLGGTVKDLAHFAMAHLDNGSFRGTQVLEPGSARTMHTGTVRIQDTHHYGLGWRDDDRNADLGTRTIWHGGAAPGYQATVVLLPEKDRALVVMQNIYGYFQAEQHVSTALGAARILAGGRPGGGESEDPMYQGLLAGLTAVAVAVTAATGWAAFRLVRPSARPVRWRRTVPATMAWVLAGLGLAYGAWFAVPESLGGSRQLIRLFTPDIGWLLAAVAIGGLALAATRLGCGLRRLGRSRAR
ncbi:beta-lactamase family protein [Streptomyces sp. A7024]|uniref:Beta-lactamase family protein n=1 Tax=Streptomyces coryli TaxID=1128680 RepID=A0A6G4U1P5_9ACTN|nr:serine hydrolase domain-containing protein [Streptomyces coryli]NGN65626.1 beta-lactamase family protein [Streptomyces coryli]